MKVNADIQQWKERLQSDPYRSYLYAYPHKTAYRPFEEPLSIARLWEQETAETFSLYMHIPFCGSRCGFCNLFTLPDRGRDAHEQYVAALERQARQWAPHTSHKPFARFAIGGGTPTLLEPALLERLFFIAEEVMGVDRGAASISVEASPETLTEEKLHLLKERRVDRISVGIQSFVEAESAMVYRSQNASVVGRSLERLRRYDFPIMNLDLIYGLPGQTVASWLYSVQRALSYRPEELFLYPLYTRQHTLIKPDGAKQSGAEDLRMACYLAARELLAAHGYVQHSMRRFARVAAECPDFACRPAPAPAGAAAAKSLHSKALLPYSCQEEGMVGLGCGARSYAGNVHFSSRYAVGRHATAGIIADYVAAASYETADYGIVLSGRERKRRFMLRALLHREGLSLPDYEARFDSKVLEDHPELELLLRSELACLESGVLRLTEEGMAYSDAIGDWLISPAIRARMEEYIVL